VQQLSQDNCASFEWIGTELQLYINKYNVLLFYPPQHHHHRINKLEKKKEKTSWPAVRVGLGLVHAAMMRPCGGLV
jgi:hypothetical protein